MPSSINNGSGCSMTYSYRNNNKTTCRTTGGYHRAYRCKGDRGACSKGYSANQSAASAGNYCNGNYSVPCSSAN